MNNNTAGADPLLDAFKNDDIVREGYADEPKEENAAETILQMAEVSFGKDFAAGLRLSMKYANDLEAIGQSPIYGPPVVNQPKYVPYQLCPKCNGNKGFLIDAPFSESKGEFGFEDCNICEGKGVIPMAIVK